MASLENWGGRLNPDTVRFKTSWGCHHESMPLSCTQKHHFITIFVCPQLGYSSVSSILILQLPQTALSTVLVVDKEYVKVMFSVVINPRRACAARVTVLDLCVCVSVYDYSRTTGNDAAYERYQQL